MPQPNSISISLSQARLFDMSIFAEQKLTLALNRFTFVPGKFYKIGSFFILAEGTFELISHWLDMNNFFDQ